MKLRHSDLVVTLEGQMARIFLEKFAKTKPSAVAWKNREVIDLMSRIFQRLRCPLK
jgi:hypothetical protein